MRGSLLAVVAVAVVAGLGVVGAVRALGLLNPPVVAEKPVPPAPPAPPPVPTVTVAGRHLFKGDTIDPRDLVVRPVRPGEEKDFAANRAEFLGDAKEVAYFRYAARDVVADTPLRLTDLAELKKPEPLNARLTPGTRAVDLAVPKELAAGGMIAVGDWVDVYLLTEVARTDSPARVPQAGVLVHSAPVIAKRGTLFSIFAGLPDGPIQHTLAVNPYRAALLDYARAVGTISLIPVSSAEKARLDELKQKAMDNPKSMALAIPFAEPGSPEYKDEQDRMERYARGEFAVGPADLARVLRLTPPAAPRSGTVQVELFTGVRPSGTATFRTADGGPAAPEFVFMAPTGADGRPAPGSTVRPVVVPPKN
jgi:Flp pilus assembly protein CpaB